MPKRKKYRTKEVKTTIGIDKGLPTIKRETVKAPYTPPKKRKSKKKKTRKSKKRK